MSSGIIVLASRYEPDASVLADQHVINVASHPSHTQPELLKSPNHALQLGCAGAYFPTHLQHRLELRRHQQLILRLRLLRRPLAGHQEVTKVLRRSETRIVVRATLHDLRPSFVRYSRLALSACSMARIER